ncbi:MAG: ABC transporter ATP-binding protein [Arenibacterium sp.]
MAASSDILNLDHVQFRWPGRAGFALDIRDFSVKAGESVLLLGQSGSGKSTLLSLICGTLLADSGAVHVAGRNIARLSNGERDRFRGEKIGMIFQQFNLLPFGTVRDNILLPLRFAPARRARAGDAAAEATRLCIALGLPKGVLTARAASLSVGQQQRVAVARALIGQPPILIADEPTSALDQGTQVAFLDLLFEQVRAQGTTLLMVSHDATLAAHFDRTARMEDIARTDREAA